MAMFCFCLLSVSFFLHLPICWYGSSLFTSVFSCWSILYVLLFAGYFVACRVFVCRNHFCVSFSISFCIILAYCLFVCVCLFLCCFCVSLSLMLLCVALIVASVCRFLSFIFSLLLCTCIFPRMCCLSVFVWIFVFCFVFCRSLFADAGVLCLSVCAGYRHEAGVSHRGRQVLSDPT